MAADNLAMEGARASGDMILTFFHSVRGSATESLKDFIIMKLKTSVLEKKVLHSNLITPLQ